MVSLQPSLWKPLLHRKGYVLIILMMVVFVLSLGLMVAVPVWQTELQREKEEELIFRGRQYVEAVRLYLMKNPGRFPSSLDELIEKKFIRKLFKDPIAKDGQWNIILNPGTPAVGGQAGEKQRILVAPASALSSLKNSIILGVVSSSTSKSIKRYEDQDRYDRWLFYYGHDPQNPPEIVYYGREKNEADEDEEEEEEKSRS